jgi:hypothetical protein
VGDEKGMSAGCANLLRNLFAALCLHITQNNLRTSLRQGAGHFRTNATGSASDCCNFATQINHAVSYALVGEIHSSHFDSQASFVFSSNR